MSNAARPVHYIAMDARASTGSTIKNGVLGSDHKNWTMRVTTKNSFSGTIKVAVSLIDPSQIANGKRAYIDFTAAESYTNPYSYVAIYDLNDPSTIIPGATGIVVTGTDIDKSYQINCNYPPQITAVITSYSAGNATVELIGNNNE